MGGSFIVTFRNFHSKEMPTKVHLTIGDQTHILKGPTVIGRNPESPPSKKNAEQLRDVIHSILVDSPAVSAHHVLVIPDSDSEGRIVIRDLHSKNGTRIDGVELEPGGSHVLSGAKAREIILARKALKVKMQLEKILYTKVTVVQADLETWDS